MSLKKSLFYTFPTHLPTHFFYVIFGSDQKLKVQNENIKNFIYGLDFIYIFQWFLRHGFFGLGKKLFDEKNYEKAAEMYEKSCYYGDAKGCIAAAKMFDTGSGIEQNADKALKYYEKGCELGFNNDQNSCTITGLKYTVLGLSFETGTNFEPNYEKAATAYEIACKYDSAQGCYNLGRLYETGAGVHKSLFHAGQSYYKACDLNDGTACYNLGRLFQTATGVTKSTEKAKMYYQKACELSCDEGCEAEKSL